MNGPDIHSRDLRRRAKLTRFAFLLATALLSAACNRQEDGKQPSAPPVQPPQTAPSVPAPAADQPGAQRQTPAPAVASKPLTDLESLVAPIALYPYPLLAELLVASTYPLEVVEAARWLDSKPDPATLKTKGWDASVMRLTEVPSVVKMMNDHLEWTTQLGDAFLAKPDELMDAIQRLRKRATDSGFLMDSPEQKVTAKTVSETQPAEPTPAAKTPSAETGTVKATPAVAKKEVIAIEPAKSDTVYVPQYNPEQVYSTSLAPPPASTAGYSYPTTSPGYPAAAPASYYPTYYPAPATTSSTDQWLSFGTGAVVGGLLTWGIMEWADDDDWDDDYHVAHYYGDAVCHDGNCWHGGGGYYGSRGDISVDRGDITRNRNVNISGSEITVNREGTFSQNQLASLKQQPTAWTHDTRHRRGQRYPEAAQQRLGQVRQPALAGSFEAKRVLRAHAPVQSYVDSLAASARSYAPAHHLASPRPKASVRSKSGKDAGRKPQSVASSSTNALSPITSTFALIGYRSLPPYTTIRRSGRRSSQAIWKPFSNFGESPRA
jgi:hypothetical protein